jgi:hypothetical protein
VPIIFGLRQHATIEGDPAQLSIDVEDGIGEIDRAGGTDRRVRECAGQTEF